MHGALYDVAGITETTRHPVQRAAAGTSAPGLALPGHERRMHVGAAPDKVQAWHMPRPLALVCFLFLCFPGFAA